VTWYTEWLDFLERHQHSQLEWGDETFGEAATPWRAKWSCCGLHILARLWKYTLPLTAVSVLGLYIGFLFSTRRNFAPDLGPEEDEWGVGQVLALALFVGPFVEFFFALWQVRTE
jgi:hypothetical protein